MTFSHTPADSLLGKPTPSTPHYDPALLFPIARAANRAALGIGMQLPFQGVDVWNAYELSWLDARGKPQVALGELRVPAQSPCLIESKSLKLYLNSYNQERLDSLQAVQERIQRDLSAAAGAEVRVALRAATQAAIEPLQGVSIDAEPVAIDTYGPPDPDFLCADAAAAPVREALVSDLLKSNCPVTGQPDWASVQVRYAGAPIDRGGLLRYLVSFREHADFHENCVERIFVDLQRRCAPAWLAVYARYTRRGGLDINPWRCSDSTAAENPRGARQ